MLWRLVKHSINLATSSETSLASTNDNQRQGSAERVRGSPLHREEVQRATLGSVTRP
jgi:hypothetical protein